MHAAKEGHATGASHVGWRAPPPPRPNRRPTNEAVTATTTTRRYCITATRRMSPPNEPERSTMTVAAPGKAPHSAVLPGSTRSRASTRPSAVATSSTESVTPAKSARCCPTAPKRAGVKLRAMRQPTTACARAKIQSGSLTAPPRPTTIIAAPSAPRRNAAGTPDT
jgi:hypothetical protein